MHIVIENGSVLDGTSIVEESLSLQESLCSESQLRFGCCEASVLKVRLIGLVPVAGKNITATITYAGQEFQLGKYKVASDKPTADRRYRDIVAYDSMYDILNTDVAEWYNTILPNDDSTVTMKAFRDSFMAHFGIEQESISLINDDMEIYRTVSPTQLSGKEVITSICEVNGCFGHIDRDGKFRYVFLPEMTEGVYPAEKTEHISAEYEDFTTARITKLQIRQEEGDIGVIYGVGDNCYVVQDNFLLYGKGSEELEPIAANLYSVISKVWYRPASINAKGNPRLEVGNAIKVPTANVDIYTYILQRNLKGIHALRDTYDAEGEQQQQEKVNSIHTQIVQLRGKANVLERTIEETKSAISDVEKGLQTQITQNAESISTEVSRATKAEGDLSSRITQTADSFSLEINNLQNQIDGNILTYNLNYVPTLTNYPAWDWTYNIPCNNTVQLRDDLRFEYKDEYWRRNARSVVFNTETFITYRFLEKDGVWGWLEIADSEYSYVLQRVSELQLSDESITASVKELEEEIIADYITKKAAQSLVTQTAESITSEVSKTYETKSNASSNYTSLNSKITQTAESITSEVTRAQNAEDSLSSRITQNANAINLRVQKGSVISEINQTPETVTIKASKIDLVGVVNATEFTSKYATISSLNAEISNVNKLFANYATIQSLNAVSAQVDRIDADYASVGSLNALSAQVERIDANYITTNDLNAVRAEINYIYSDYVKASTLGDDVVTSISGKSVYLGAIQASGIINANGGLTVNGYDMARKTATIGGTTIHYWGWD